MNPDAHDGRLEVVRGGAGCTVQDAGRVGHRHEGVALAGWLDGWMAGAANALVYSTTDSASAVRNIVKMVAGGLEVGPILMGMGNKAHIVTP